jgi:S1-C subfamily serine protease
VLGFFTERDAAGQLIARDVDPESAAAQAGLRSGDVILIWNGSEPPRNPERWVYSQKAGNLVRLRVRRDDHEMSIEFRIGEITETIYQVVEDPRADARARRIREGILRGITQPVTASNSTR